MWRENVTFVKQYYAEMFILWYTSLLWLSYKAFEILVKCDDVWHDEETGQENGWVLLQNDIQANIKRRQWQDIFIFLIITCFSTSLMKFTFQKWHSGIISERDECHFSSDKKKRREMKNRRSWTIDFFPLFCIFIEI